jgi:hypothetical protein
MFSESFFFSEDGLTFIRLSEVTGVTRSQDTGTQGSYFVHLKNREKVLVVDTDTVTELFAALQKYGES